MSSLAQYSPWHKAYAGFKGAVKESAGKIFGDKKLETEGKADKAAGKAVGGSKDAVREIGQHHQRRLLMELILIIVVLLLLFGGGGGYFGRRRGYW
jgi:uncharacterized protein YjbJ (UPF0337 family)